MIKTCLTFLLAVFCMTCFTQTKAVIKQMQIADSLEKITRFDQALDLRKTIETSQPVSDEEWNIINRYKIELNSSYLQDNDSLSLVRAEKANDLFSTLKNKDKTEEAAVMAHLYRKQYDNYLDEDALNTAKTALELYRLIDNKNKALITIDFIVSQLDYLGRFSEALDYCKTGLLLSKDLDESDSKLANRYMTIASINSRTNDLDAQIKALKKAELVLKDKDIPEKFTLYSLYNMLFITYYSYGDIDSAKNYLDQLNNYYQLNQGDDTFMNFKQTPSQKLNLPLTIKTTANIVYSKYVSDTKKLDAYVTAFEKNLPIDISNLSENDLLDINDIYIQKAIYNTQNIPDYEKALTAFQIPIKYNVQNSYTNGLMNLYYHMGYIQSYFKKWDEAIKSYEKAREFPGIERYYMYASLKQNLGKAYVYQNNFEKAIPYLDEVLALYDGPLKVNLYHGNVRDLFEIGDLYFRMYEESDTAIYLEKAFDAYKKSALVFSKIYQGDMYNSILSSFSSSIKSGLLNCAVLMPDKHVEVLELIENNNSDYLWSKFVSNQKDTNFDSPKTLNDSLNFIKNEIDYSESLFRTLGDSDEKSNLKLKIDSFKTKLNTIEKTLKTKFPSYYEFATRTFSLDNLQKNLTENDLVIKYETLKSNCYVYKISNTEVALYELQIEKSELQSKVNTFIAALSKPSVSVTFSDEDLSSILTNTIILDKDKGKNLTIITNNFLSRLPFEVLKFQDETLLQNFDVSYSSSIKLKIIQQSTSSSSNSGLVAFSPQYTDGKGPEDNRIVYRSNRSGNAELFGALNESTEVTKIFSGDLFKGEDASKSNFLNKLKDYSIFHLAMHGYIDDENSAASSLLFSNGESLYLSELYNLDIPAELSVLSACNTGSGKLLNGEGIINLSRAFTYSGVKSTVYSLWEVPDQETSLIMIDFYKNLKAGEAKDVALANAKRRFIETNPLKSHPFYWSGFVVNGNTSAISKDEFNYWILIGALVIIFGIGIWAYRKRR